MNEEDDDLALADQEQPEEMPVAGPVARHGPAPANIQAEFNRRFNAGAQQMLHTVRKAGITPVDVQNGIIQNPRPGEPPPLDTSIPVTEPDMTPAPVAAKHIANDPATAALLGHTPEALEATKNLEQAFQGEFNVKPMEKMTPPSTPEEMAAEQKSTALHPLFAAEAQERRDAIDGLRVLGISTPDMDKQYAWWGEKQKEWVKTEPNFFGHLLEMVPSLGEQYGTGAAAAIATSGLATPAIHAIASVRAGFDAMGHEFGILKGLPTADGKPVSDEVARAGALIMGAVTTGEFFLGGKLVKSTLGPLVSKLGGGAAAAPIVERVLSKAIGNSAFRARLAEFGAQGLSTSAALNAFSLVNDLLEPELQRELSQAPTSNVPPPDPRQGWNNVKRELDPETQLARFALGPIMGTAVRGAYAVKGLAAERLIKSMEVRDKGLDVEQTFAEQYHNLLKVAYGNTDVTDKLVPPIAEMSETHGDPNVNETRSLSVKTLRDFQKDTMGGQAFHPEVEKRIAAAETSGTDVVLPTERHIAHVLTMADSKKLKNNTRVGEAPTISEEQQAAEALEAGKEDPVEADTKRIANDIATKLIAKGDIPERAQAYGDIVSEAWRVASIDKSRRLGTEPRPFEDYARVGPIELTGGRESAILEFEKGRQRVEAESAAAARQKGALEPTVEELKRREAGKGEPATPLEKLQEVARKKLGETFLGFRTQGETYLSAERALGAAKGEEVTPVYLRPEDLTGAKPGGVVTHGELPKGRARPMPEKLLREAFTEEGRKGIIWETFQEAAQRMGSSDILLRGFIDPNYKGMYPVTLTGNANTATFFHESGHYIHYVLSQFAPEKLADFNKWIGVDPKAKIGDLTGEQRELFARAVEQYLLEGRAPAEHMSDLFQTIARYMRASYDGLSKTGIALDETVTRGLDRTFALEEHLDEVGKILGFDETGLDQIVTPERLSELRDKREAAKTAAFNKAREAAGRLGRKAARESLEEYEKWAKSVSDDPAEQKDLAEMMMQAANPGWVATDDWVKSEGEKAINNAAHDELRKAEMKMLGEILGHKGEEEVTRIAIEHGINDLLDSKTMKDLKPWVAFRGEASAIAKMKEAIGKNDIESAWEYSKQAYRARYTFKQMLEMKNDFTKSAERMQGLVDPESTTRKNANKGGKEYSTIIDWVLQGLGFKEDKTVGAKDVTAALETLAARHEPFYWPVQFTMDGGLQPWKQMDSDTLRTAFETVDSAVKQGLQKNKLIFHDKQLDLDETVHKLVEPLVKIAEKRAWYWPFKGKPEPVTVLKERAPALTLEAGKIVSSMVDALKIPEATISRVAGGKLGSDFHRQLYQPIDDGVHESYKANAKTIAIVEKALTQPAPGESQDSWNERSNRLVDGPFPGAKRVFVKDIIDIVGKLGDFGTMDRFLRGEGPEHTRDGYVAWINGLMAKGDLTPYDVTDRVQMLVDHAKSKYAPTAEIKERNSGWKPPQIKESPVVFTDKDGGLHIYRGGYWGFDYDSARARDPVMKATLESMDPTAGWHATPTMNTQFMEARTAAGKNAPLQVGLESYVRRMSAMDKYINLWEPLDNARKILLHPEMQQFLNTYHPGTDNVLYSWLADMARRPVTGTPFGLDGWNKGVRYLRAGTNNAMLLFNVHAPWHQATGVLAAMEHASPASIVSGVVHAMTNWDEFSRIYNTSHEVKSASSVVEAALPMSELERLYNKTSPSEWTKLNQHMRDFNVKFGMGQLKAMQQISSTFVYKAVETETIKKLTQAMQERAAKGEAPTALDVPGSPEWNKLVNDTADAAVRRAHTASGWKDLSAWSRGGSNPAQAFTYLQNYGINLFNHAIDSGHAFRRGDLGQFMRIIATNFTLPGIAVYLINNGLSAITDKKSLKDAGLALAKIGAAGTFMQFTKGVPIIGQSANNVLNNFLEDKDLGLHNRAALEIPVFSTLDKLSKEIGQHMHAGRAQHIPWTPVVHDGAQFATELSGIIPMLGPAYGAVRTYERASDAFQFVKRVWMGQDPWKDTNLAKKEKKK